MQRGVAFAALVGRLTIGGSGILVATEKLIGAAELKLIAPILRRFGERGHAANLKSRLRIGLLDVEDALHIGGPVLIERVRGQGVAAFFERGGIAGACSACRDQGEKGNGEGREMGSGHVELLSQRAEAL